MPLGLSNRQFAALDGCDEGLVRRRKKSGHLAQLADGTVDPALVGTAWRARRNKPADQSADTGADIASLHAECPHDQGSPAQTAERLIESGEVRLLSKADAEAKKENFLALLRELEYFREKDLVVAVDDVVMAVVGEYARVRAKLLSIPTRIAPRAAPLRTAEEIRALLEAEVTLALQELTLDFAGSPDRSGDVQRRFGRTSQKSPARRM